MDGSEVFERNGRRSFGSSWPTNQEEALASDLIDVYHLRLHVSRRPAIPPSHLFRKLLDLPSLTVDISTTATMPELENPDPDELGGNVTKPFKFVTGMSYASLQRL